MKACEIRRGASARTTWKLQEYTKQSYEKKIFKLHSIFGRLQYYRKTHNVSYLRRTRHDQPSHRHIST